MRRASKVTLQHPLDSPSTAPAKKRKPLDWSSSRMKRHLQCAEQQVSAPNFQILRLPRSLKGQDCSGKSFKPIYLLPPKEIRFDTDPSLQHVALRRSPKIPRNRAPARKGHSPPSPNTAPAAKSHCPPPSANMAPATQTTHDWSASHMKRHLQCAEQVKSVTLQTRQVLPPTKFWVQDLSEKSRNCFRQKTDDSKMTWPWSGHIPIMKAPAASETLLVASWRRILDGKMKHFALRLSPKISRNAAPATKSHSPPHPIDQVRLHSMR